MANFTASKLEPNENKNGKNEELSAVLTLICCIFTLNLTYLGLFPVF